MEDYRAIEKNKKVREKTMNINMMDFPKYTDKYGNLIPIEENETVPFEIKRVYYIYGVEPNVRRGFHSHVELEQVLICVSGEVKILVKTPDEEEIITLNNPEEGLYIGPMVWREMFDFSEDAVLLILASEHYNVEDYIRDYRNYEKIAKEYFAGKK